ncbi:hypothetical protein BH10ACI3_BH10ACI3_13840 [soil metagenome]
MKNSISIGLIIFASAWFAAAQAPASTDAKKAEMKKVEKMAGKWKGSGWIQQGPQRETFTGSETVQKKLDGLAMLVEGNFANPAGKVIHQTLAVLTCNEKMNGYDFATYLASGISGKYDYKAEGDHFEWGFQIPNYGTVRYSIKIDDTTWHEIGEYSRDGKSWTQNFEMTLKRVK